MQTNLSSRLPNFYDLTLEQRLEKIVQIAGLGAGAKATLRGDDGLSLEQADYMIESVRSALEKLKDR